MIKIDAISKSYESGQGALTVFSDFSLTLEERQIVALIGPSGCGKTTLLHMLAGMEKVDSGCIEGVPISSTTNVASLSYLFQEPRLLPWKTLHENIELVLENHIEKKREREVLVKEFIDIVGLGGFEHMYPRELSGGMRQRVAIARAFAYPSQLILMDEPFQSLDADLKFNLIEAYQNLWAHTPRTTLLVTHDIQEALLLADKVVVLSPRPAQIRGIIDVDVRPEDRVAGNRRIWELEMHYYEKFSHRG